MFKWCNISPTDVRTYLMDEEQLPKQLKQLPNSTEWLKNGRWTEFSRKQELVPICSPMEVFIYLPNNFPEEFNNRSEKQASSKWWLGWLFSQVHSTSTLSALDCIKLNIKFHTYRSQVQSKQHRWSPTPQVQQSTWKWNSTDMKFNWCVLVLLCCTLKKSHNYHIITSKNKSNICSLTSWQ